MEQNGIVRDVTGMDNRKTDDVMSVSSAGQTVSRDRHVAERMYVYYWTPAEWLICDVICDVGNGDNETGLCTYGYSDVIILQMISMPAVSPPWCGASNEILISLSW